MAKRIESGKIKRTIYFYNLYTYEIDDSSIPSEKIVETNSDRLTSFFTQLQNQQINAIDKSKFFIDLPNSNRLLVLIDTIHPSEVFFRMILSRVNALPQIEQNGNLESLGDLINQDQNIAEVTHCIYYRHYGTMGAEFNSSGAYPSKIADYINTVNASNGINSYFVECNSKLDDNVFRKLDQNRDFSLFDLSLRNDEHVKTYLEKQRGLRELFGSIPDTDTAQIVLKKRKTKKNEFTGFNPPLDIAAMHDFVHEYRESIERFHVSQNRISDPIDLLSDKYMERVMVDVSDKRTIEPSEMYLHIGNAFNGKVKEYCIKYDEDE